MKKYTHAWLAFMAIKRLEDAEISVEDRKYADSLIRWLKRHRDDVIQGAWYPDAVIKDMANSHVLKHTPSNDSVKKFKTLPDTYLSYEYGKSSSVKGMSFTVEQADNLPDRCESIAESVIDNLKMQEREDKGSPVSPTDNHIALLLFMLSHYVADAHMPLHCDSRAFSEGANLHEYIEGEWEDLIGSLYRIDRQDERFLYDPFGYPLRDPAKESDYQSSPLKGMFERLTKRKFIISWGGDNKNVWDFMNAICQYSYLLSYCFIPKQYTRNDVTLKNWDSLGSLSFNDLSVSVFSDAIDSIARIWLRVWRRYMIWETEQRAKK